MFIHYYKSADDAVSHRETVEAIDWMDGFATEDKNEIVFKKSSDGEELSILFQNFISVV